MLPNQTMARNMFVLGVCVGIFSWFVHNVTQPGPPAAYANLKLVRELKTLVFEADGVESFVAAVSSSDGQDERRQGSKGNKVSLEAATDGFGDVSFMVGFASEALQKPFKRLIGKPHYFLFRLTGQEMRQDVELLLSVGTQMSEKGPELDPCVQLNKGNCLLFERVVE